MFPPERKEITINKEVNPVLVYNYIRPYVRVVLEDIIALGLDWQDNRGMTFVKKLKKVYKNIPNNVLGILGSKLVAGEEKFLVSVNQELWSPGDYGDFNSCFFASKSGAPYLIFKYEGKAIKINGANSHARAWVLPYQGFYYVFNIYSTGGNLSSKENWWEILREITGKEWKEVRLYAKGGLLYINDNKALTTVDNPNGSCELDLYYRCGVCGKEYFDDGEYDGGIFKCSDCSGETAQCELCGGFFAEENLYYAQNGLLVCGECLDNHAPCSNCGEYYYKDDMILDAYRDYVCKNCAEDYVNCDDCLELVPQNHLVTGFGGNFCEYCGLDTEVCDTCHRSYYRHNLDRIGKKYICKNCAEALEKELEDGIR